MPCQYRINRYYQRGITAVEGRFSRGEVVKIKNNTSGKVIALGMPRYNSDALELIKGKKSQDIEQILGYEYGAVALHRDDMIVLQLKIEIGSLIFSEPSFYFVGL